MRILNTGTEVEAAVADALVRTENCFCLNVNTNVNQRCCRSSFSSVNALSALSLWTLYISALRRLEE